MTIGPEPIRRIFWMSSRLGIHGPHRIGAGVVHPPPAEASALELRDQGDLAVYADAALPPLDLEATTRQDGVFVELVELPVLVDGHERVEPLVEELNHTLRPAVGPAVDAAEQRGPLAVGVNQLRRHRPDLLAIPALDRIPASSDDLGVPRQVTHAASSRKRSKR